MSNYIRWEKDSPRAKKKSRGKPVEIDKPVNVAPDKSLVDYVTQNARNKVERAFPLAFRRQFDGNVDVNIEQPTGYTRINVSLEHRSNTIVIVANVLLSKGCVERNNIADRATYGSLLGERCIKELKAFKAKQEKEKPRKVYLGKFIRVSEYENVRSQPAKKKRKPKADCALCGLTDAAFPEWEGTCEHTKEERKGD